MGNWMDEKAYESASRSREQQNAIDLRAADQRKYDELAHEYWRTVRDEHIIPEIDDFNARHQREQRISLRERTPHIIAEKSWLPAGIVNIHFSKNAQQIDCTYQVASAGDSWTTLPSRKFSVMVGRAGLYLELHGKPIPPANIADEMLREFLEAIW